jgi:hypothetical protein
MGKELHRVRKVNILEVDTQTPAKSHDLSCEVWKDAIDPHRNLEASLVTRHLWRHTRRYISDLLYPRYDAIDGDFTKTTRVKLIAVQA